MNTISFFITSFIIILIPGTGVTYTISTGITKGKKDSIFAALGCTLGIGPHLCLSIALSSFLMNMSHNAFFIIKIIGAIYLLYLGIGMIKSKTNFELENNKLGNNAGKLIRRGIFINLLNPKLTLFFSHSYLNTQSQLVIIILLNVCFMEFYLCLLHFWFL